MATTLNPHLLLLVPLAPLAGALIVGLFGTAFFGNIVGRKACHTIAILGVFCALALSIHTFIAVQAGAHFDAPIYTWMTLGDVRIEIGFLIDSLTAIMMCVVSFVSLMVHIYTIGYMEEDEGYNRFFAYISLFTFAMLILVMSNNLLQLFFGWEAVGLVSYLLIGFWMEKPTAIVANIKAFLVNRIGDFGFVLGIGALFAYADSMHYADIFAQSDWLATQTLAGTDWSLLSVVCLCLFFGAMAKSAQFPLHVWLPDSMEGPTPISALIHAATMVTAGIFMVTRMSPLFELSETALSTILIIGGITALFMGLVAMVQNDIKRVIAYSTLSQLGYMTVALGASAYAASAFHLVTHAFFKALLFLAAGAVIVGMHHEQDIRFMGGLRKYMPIAAVTSLIGTLALVGMPFFSGFYSKESIIDAVRQSQLFGAEFATVALTLGVFVTAFYSFRLYFLVFHGKERFEEAAYQLGHDPEHGLAAGEKPHEAPLSMTIPLIILAIPSIALGYFAIEPFLYSGLFDGVIAIHPEHQAMAIMSEHFHGALGMTLHGLMSVPLCLGIAGGVLAAVFYLVKPHWPQRLSYALAPFYALLQNQYYIDSLYKKVFVRLAKWIGDKLWRWGDQRMIDGLVVNGSAKVVLFLGDKLWRWGDQRMIDGVIINGGSRMVLLFSAVVRRWQSGYLYHYAFVMIVSLLLFLLYFMPIPLLS